MVVSEDATSNALTLNTADDAYPIRRELSVEVPQLVVAPDEQARLDCRNAVELWEGMHSGRERAVQTMDVIRNSGCNVVEIRLPGCPKSLVVPQYKRDVIKRTLWIDN